MMDNPKKILHIDPDFNITYFLIRPGAVIKSSLSLLCAIQLLKEEKLDLILSEPHNKAILTPQDLSKEMDWKSVSQDFMEVRNGRFR
jgi:hypothetical protein